MKHYIAALLFTAALAVAACAEEEYDDPELTATGGYLRKEGSGRGKIVIVNTLEDVTEGDYLVALDTFNCVMHLPIEIKSAPTASRPSQAEVRRIGASLAIFVVEDRAQEESLLVAPESRWALVNVASLRSDQREQTVLRIRKEVLRAFSLLCGVANSDRRGMVTGPVAGVSDLDKMRIVCIPLESYTRVLRYLSGMGVEPYIEATYETACQQGWAPAPTNKYQRAIWKRIHTPPEKPLKITYDKDKQQPVVK